MTASESLSSSPRKFSPPVLARAFLTLLVFALFGPSIGFEFNYQDDSVNTFGNPHLNPVTIPGVLQFWTQGYVGLYIPVTYTFWAALSQFSALLTAGTEPFSPAVFHAANVLMHLASVLLVFSILRRLFDGPRALLAALAGAALFALHPLQVEPVAWVTGMKDILSGALSLGAILLYLKCLPPAGSRASQGIAMRPYLAATFFFAAAVLAKPSAVAVPAILFFLELGFLAKNGSWTRPLRLLGPWAAIAVMIVITAKFLQPQNSGFVATPLWFRPVVMLDALGFYLRQMFWPVTLSSDYGRSPQTLFSFGLWKHLGWIALAFLIAAAAFPKARGRNLCHLAILGAAILPYSGLIPFAFQVQSTVADRYAYLALFAAALLLGRLLEQSPARATVAIAVSVIAAFGIRSATHLTHFKTEESVYRHSLAGNPKSAHIRFNLANTLRNADRPDEAAEQYRILIKQKPDFAAPYVNLAAILSERDQHEEAAELYHTAIALKGQFEPYAHHGLAGTLMARRQFGEADRHFQAAIQLDPIRQSRYVDWAHALEQQERHADAAAVYAEAAAHTSAPLVFHRMTAKAWHNAGDLDRCNALLVRILAENPSDAFALNLLAWVRATAERPPLRDGAEAVRLATAACSLTRNQDPAALDTLAAAYAAVGNFEDAMKTLTRMVDSTRNLSAADHARAERVFERRAKSYRKNQALAGPAAKPFLELAAQ